LDLRQGEEKEMKWEKIIKKKWGLIGFLIIVSIMLSGFFFFIYVYYYLPSDIWRKNKPLQLIVTIILFSIYIICLYSGVNFAKKKKFFWLIKLCIISGVIILIYAIIMLILLYFKVI
jgi:hypothetical protein